MTVIESTLKDLGYTEQIALKEFALLNASQKKAEFEQENQYFESKYKSSFSEFEHNIKSANDEIFEHEDDYLAWKFVFDGIGYWQSRVAQLRLTA